MDLSFLVHDFEAICNKLKPLSRVVLVDVGASLEFHHREQHNIGSPAIYLIELFQKFGIRFDHIYAFEITPTDPSSVYELIPEDLLASYHWINQGVSADAHSKMNPWNLILDSFTEDDFVVVKLDIDTPAIELPLVKQLLLNPVLHKLVDHFYFEHHSRIGELEAAWGPEIEGTAEESFRLFYQLRQKGIAAHSWV